MLGMWSYCIVLALILLVGRAFWVIRPTRRNQQGRRGPRTVCVVLGSGGHTSELFANLSELDPKLWRDVRPFYVISATDSHSEQIAVSFEQDIARRTARCRRIPRAREVGQSYQSSIWTTLKALAACFSFMYTEAPDVILTNGPGVCVPVVAASLLMAVLGLVRRPLLLYTESFTCVDHVSLSGKILLHVVNVFCVQWPELEAIVGRGRSSVVQTGPKMDQHVVGGSSSLLPAVDQVSTRSGECLVTVGSTFFDELVAASDREEFLDALKAFSEANNVPISKLTVQKGQSAHHFSVLRGDGTEFAATKGWPALQSRVVQYVPFLKTNIQTSSLLLSHAGAGTILEALAAGTPLIVVPNERLMSNHQLALARALDSAGFLFFVPVKDLITRLPMLRVASLRRFPPPNRAAIREAFGKVLDAQ